MANDPVAPSNQDAASIPVPDDRSGGIHYTVNALGTPTFASPASTGPAGLPGHAQADGAAVRAQVAANYAAATNTAAAKASAQLGRDLAASRPKFTPAPKGR